MKNVSFIFLTAALGFLGACQQKSLNDESNLIKDTVNFSSVKIKNPFPDAILEMYSPLFNQKFKEGKVPFEFNITNYPFGKVDENYHLMLIINGNNPLSYVSPNFNLDLKSGAYRIIAYLVDDKGHALKDFGNFVDREFKVGDSGSFPYSEEAYLAVNLPHNLEVFSIGQEIQVDFLVLGGDLKKDQLIVKIKVNEWSFETQEIAPITIDNLPKGEYQVIISLERKDGEELKGPFSKVIKSIIVEENIQNIN
jgi:hypothetical protein